GKRILSAARTAERKRLAPEAVVLFALLLVAEHRIRFGDLLEFVLGLLVPLVFVGVELLREASIGLFDLLLGRRFLHAEDFVVVLLSHGRGKYIGRSPLAVRRLPNYGQRPTANGKRFASVLRA